MEIKIELTQKEALGIIVKHFQPMFPDKVIKGDIKSYGGVNLEVNDKTEPKPESESEV